MTEEENTRNIPSKSIASLEEAGNVSVLIVEDDKFLRDLMVEKLKKEGYKVTEAFDGDEGLRLIKEIKPTIVLLDLVLPGTDGFDVLKAVLDDNEVKSIPIIVLSNLGTREDIERAMSLGAKNFLVKAHFTPVEIIETVKKTIKDTYL